MGIVILGLIGAIVAGCLGVSSVLLTMTKENLWRPRSWSRLERVRIGLIFLGTVISSAIILVQGRSATISEARQTQLKEDLFAFLYKQEFVRAVTLNVTPEGCLSESEQKPGKMTPVPMWADNVPRLLELVAGRSPKPDEMAIVQLHFKYGGIWIVAHGQANATEEHWFYSAGSDQIRPGATVMAFPFPPELNSPYSKMGLLDLRLNDGHLRQFITNSPSIQSIIQQKPFMTSTFDPRDEMGFFNVAQAGFYRSKQSAKQFPPAQFNERAERTPVKVPDTYLRCWDVRLTVNGRLIANAMKKDGFMKQLEQKLSHWPKLIIDQKLQEGLVWLAPSPGDWRELRPLMNCRVAWLLYGGDSAPCV